MSNDLLPVPAPSDTPLDLDSLPPLTDRQTAWLAHYLSDAKFNATEAARLAGYGGSYHNLRDAGYVNRTNPYIQIRIRAYMQAEGLLPDEVIAHMSSMAMSNIRDAVDFHEDGTWSFNPAKAEALGREHTIKSLKRRRRKRGRGDNQEVEEEEELVMHDPQPYLHDLAMIYKLFPERNPQVNAVQVNVNTQPMSREDEIAEIKRLAARLGLRIVEDDTDEQSQPIIDAVPATDTDVADTADTIP